MIKFFYRLTFSYFVFLSVEGLRFAPCAVTVWESSGIPPVQITTNGQARDLISAFELNAAQYSKLRKEFEWMDDAEFESARFFNYRGQIYSLADFIRTEGDLLVKGWQGMHSWYASAGLLVKLVDSCQSVIVGTYTC